jgi:hypothetical protein
LAELHREVTRRKEEYQKQLGSGLERSSDIEWRIRLIEAAIEIIKESIETPRGDQTKLFKG